MKEPDMLFSASSHPSSALHFRYMEEGSSSSTSSSSIQLPGSSPAIDRYNPIILDPRRLGSSSNSNSNVLPSCSSPAPKLLSPTPPPPNRQIHNTNNTSDQSFASKINSKLNKKKHKHTTIKDDTKKSTNDANNSISTNTSNNIMSGRRSWSCINMNTKKPEHDGFISPSASSRYLLSENAFLNVISDFDPVSKLPPPPGRGPEPPKTSLAIRKHETAAANSMHSTTAPPAVDQVVVLRVSLHCRGCERKMRKHLSKMEGVSSFDIDFVAKKVTVVGKVTPLEVLTNILKVKNAQLWTPPVPFSQSKQI